MEKYALVEASSSQFAVSTNMPKLCISSDGTDKYMNAG
jgi:hypothetical protein